MTKKRSKNLFILFAIILVVCLVACFVNFTYPFMIEGNYYSYSNFISNIRLGDDIGDSLRIIYRADLPDDVSSVDYSSLRESVMSDLQSIVQGEGYKDVSVLKYGDDSILVNIGNILNDEEENAIVNLIGNPATISFTLKDDGSEPFAKSESVKDVYATSYNDPETGTLTYYVVVKFADEYKSTMVNKSEEGDIYIYLGDTQFASIQKGNITSEGIISFSSDSFVSYETANTCANQIRIGMLDLELTQIECDMVSASAGIGSIILLGIAMVVFLIGCFVFLIIKYKHMGWISSFAILFYIVISLFLVQSVPFVHVNFAGIIAMVISLIVAIDSIMSIIEKAKKHYQDGAKLHIAFKMAMKESLTRVLFTNAVLLVAGFISLFMPNLAVQSFGWIVFISSFVTAFISLVLMRLFINMYLALNNTDGSKCNFHKGGKNA